MQNKTDYFPLSSQILFAEKTASRSFSCLEEALLAAAALEHERLSIESMSVPVAPLRMPKGTGPIPVVEASAVEDRAPVLESEPVVDTEPRPIEPDMVFRTSAEPSLGAQVHECEQREEATLIAAAVLLSVGSQYILAGLGLFP